MLFVFYIGIDIGKFNHCACVVSSEGEVLIEPFFFTNNLEGFESFIKAVKKYKSPRHIVGLEATGHYGDNLISFLIPKISIRRKTVFKSVSISLFPSLILGLKPNIPKLIWLF